MRYSNETKREAKVLPGGKRDHQDFFKQAIAKSPADAADVALVLIGGSDHRSLAMRRAQGSLRFDRQPSLWSHVAILFELNRGRPGRSRGVEVTLDPIEAAKQVPERNAVTEFTLARYFDRRRYPNVAFVSVRFVVRESAARQRAPEPKSLIVSKLGQPMSDAQRYPLWNSLGVWARYTYTPELLPNPLLDNVFMPCAALCEFGFEAAGIDLTPGASGNNTCPELIWSTVTHWQRSLESSLKLDVYVSKADEKAASPDPLTLTLPLARRRS